MSTSLVIRFPDQSESFVHGYEAGRLAHKMALGDHKVENDGFPIHTANEEILRAMCQYFGYIPKFSPCIVKCDDPEEPDMHFDGWLYFHADKMYFSEN